jgi:hypothetical protein
MAITQAICNSYKQEILEGVHLASHEYRIALFTSSATLSKATTTYTGQGNEVGSGNGYTTGGAELTGPTVTLDGDTAVLTWSTPVEWSSATFTARGALIYNNTLAGKNAVQVLDFTQDYTATNGTFAVSMPTANATTGLLRIT